MYELRTYRCWVKDDDLTCFEVVVRVTDLFIRAEKNLRKKALRACLKHRSGLEKYISQHPEFLYSLQPVRVKAEAPCLLWEGYPVLDAEFPAPAKKRLDEIRSRVAPTLPNHHYYRACGGAISESLSLAEKLLEAGRPEEEVMQLFKEVVEREAPLNQRLQIIHVKLDGRIIRLGLAEVKERREDGCLRLVRAIKSRGVYDGLGTPREPTDLAITDVKPGSWYFCTTYLSSGGESKGVYININTPVELYPNKIRYVDLGVDVCIKPDGEVKVLDLEEPVKAAEQGVISQRLLDRIESLVDRLVSGIRERGVEFVKEI